MRIRQFLLPIALVCTVACASSGGAIDLSKLPPIVIGAPSPTPEPQPVALAPLATLAFQVVDDDTGGAIPTAFVTFDDATSKQVNADGYAAFERAASASADKPAIYKVTIEADDYQAVTRRFQLDENRQFTVRLKSTRPRPVDPPPPPPGMPPVVEPPPPVAPPPSIVQGQLSIEQVVVIARRVHDAEGWNLGGLSSREYRNRFWERVVGIVHFGHELYNLTADPRWHVKDAGGGRPMSDDVVVLMPSREYWDCIPGAGADGYSFRASPDGILPSDQRVYAPRRPEAGAVRP